MRNFLPPPRLVLLLLGEIEGEDLGDGALTRRMWL